CESLVAVALRSLDVPGGTAPALTAAVGYAVPQLKRSAALRLARPFRFAPGAMSRVASLPGPRKARAFSPLRCVNAVNGHRSAMP
ncbi:hypothetical protein, partial [Streptomyces drozdowiczii]|uniref:hypothetical protein n=1 Tax=Streptomyces drozdowiczii TaxID=202862 RepID=UPI00403C40E7